MSYVWEQRKLDKIADVRDGTHDSPKYVEEGHPFITSKNIKEGYINYEDVQYISNKDFEEINKRSKVDINDILMGMIGTVGNIAIVREKPNFAIKNVALIKDTGEVFYLYLYHCLQSNSVVYQLSGNLDGGTQKFIALNKIRNLSIPLPNEDEQYKIGNHMECLDHLITLHQRKILLYKYFFTIVWEQRKLGKIFVSMQNNTLSRADLSYDSGVAMNVHYGDILVKFGEVLDIKSERLPMIVDETVLDKYKSSFLKNGDIIIADTAEDETVGKCTEIADLSDEYVISGLHTIPYRPLQKFAFGYLGYYMNSTSYHNQLLPLMQGIKVTSISKVSLQNTVIIYPKSKVEQAAIGKYFYNLDNLITLHRCKCIIYRKNMVNDWEQRKLEDLLSLLKDGTHATHKDVKDGVLLLSAKNIKNGRIYWDETDRRISYKDYENIHSNFKLQKDDVLLTIVGSIGETAILHDFNGITFQRSVAFLRPNKCLDSKFLYSEIQSLRFQKELDNRKSTSAQPGIYLRDLAQIPVILPENILEQNAIGSFFESLDTLITLHQWKCIVCTKIKVNTWIQCKFIKIGVKLQKCILLSIILLFKRRKVSCVFYVNILLRFIKVIELEVELVFVIIDGTIIVMFYLKIRCLYFNIFIFKINK